MFLKTNALLLTMHVGGSVCNGVGVAVAVQHLGIFLGNQFSIYRKLSLCIRFVQKTQ